jgi:hypothetical protein
MPQHLNEYIFAFNILNSSRQTGFNSPQSLPLSELISYKNEFGTPNGFRIFIAIMQAIDQFFLGYINKNVECTDKFNCKS